MRNLKKRTNLGVSMLVLTMATAGCSLAPREEVLPDAPVIAAGSVQEYKKVAVIRGDLIDSVQVDCTYKAFHTERLKFHRDGVRINHIYAKEGDLVKAGDVLADLEMNDVNQQMEDLTFDIELIKMKITQEEEQKELASATLSKIKKTRGFENHHSTEYELAIKGHASAIDRLQDDLYIQQKRLEQIKETKKDHQIVAGIDGIVSYVASDKEGAFANKDKTFFVVDDPDSMVFITNGNNEDLFEPGQKVSVEVADHIVQTVVLGPEAFGNNEETDMQHGEVYLGVEDKENQLQDGDRGQITFIQKEIKDTLYLPSSVVHEENGETIVYVDDEDGFKSTKEIEVGETIDRKVEILSGLDEGDSVILD